MKLLFDNNLSDKLIAKLDDLFPGSTHVMIKGLDESDDQEIWIFAKENGFTIVTKDSDFNDLSVTKGSPPKVIWLKIGNCRVPDIENIIRNNIKALNKFLDNPEIEVIEIYQFMLTSH